MSKGLLDGYKTYDPQEEGYGNSYEWKKNFRKRMTKEDALAFLKDDDPWVVLQIRPGSSKEAIQTAWKRLCKLWHPDINKAENALDMQQRINAAYDALR